jgi:hypothetical protein
VNDPYSGFIDYARELLDESDGKQLSGEYEQYHRQIARESLRGTTYVLKRLNQLMRAIQLLREAIDDRSDD